MSHSVMPGRETVSAGRYGPRMRSGNPSQNEASGHRPGAQARPVRSANRPDAHEDAVCELRGMFLALFEEANDAIQEILGAGRLEMTRAGLRIDVLLPADGQTEPPVSRFEYACRDRGSITIASMVHGHVQRAHDLFARDRLTHELTAWVRAVLSPARPARAATPEETGQR